MTQGTFSSGWLLVVETGLSSHGMLALAVSSASSEAMMA